MVLFIVIYLLLLYRSSLFIIRSSLFFPLPLLSSLSLFYAYRYFLLLTLLSFFTIHGLFKHFLLAFIAHLSFVFSLLIVHRSLSFSLRFLVTSLSSSFLFSTYLIIIRSSSLIRLLPPRYPFARLYYYRYLLSPLFLIIR